MNFASGLSTMPGHPSPRYGMARQDLGGSGAVASSGMGGSGAPAWQREMERAQMATWFLPPVGRAGTAAGSASSMGRTMGATRPVDAARTTGLPLAALGLQANLPSATAADGDVSATGSSVPPEGEGLGADRQQRDPHSPIPEASGIREEQMASAAHELAPRGEAVGGLQGDVDPSAEAGTAAVHERGPAPIGAARGDSIGLPVPFGVLGFRQDPQAVPHMAEQVAQGRSLGGARSLPGTALPVVDRVSALTGAATLSVLPLQEALQGADEDVSAETLLRTRLSTWLDASPLLGASPAPSRIGVYSERLAEGQGVWLAVPAATDGEPLLAQIPAIVNELQRAFAACSERLWRVVCNGSTVWEDGRWTGAAQELDDERSLPSLSSEGRSFQRHCSMEK